MDELYIITLFRSLFYASIFNLNEPFNFFHNSFVCQNEMDLFLVVFVCLPVSSTFKKPATLFRSYLCNASKFDLKHITNDVAIHAECVQLGWDVVMQKTAE